MDWNQQPGIWVTIGLLLGILADTTGRLIVRRIYRPILTYPQDSELNIWPVYSTMELYPPGTSDTANIIPDHRQGIVWRIQIRNKGKSAALNVQGTLELKQDKPKKSHEQRICWYEQGNRSSITLNDGDHSFLDLFGVVGNDIFAGTVAIPMEHGWRSPLYPTLVNGKEIWRLRVTAANCKRLLLEFNIDPSEDYKPVNIRVISPELDEQNKAQALLKSLAQKQAWTFFGLTIGLSSFCVIAYFDLSKTAFHASLIPLVPSIGIFALLTYYGLFESRSLRRSTEFLVKVQLQYVAVFIGMVSLAIVLIQRGVILWGLIVFFVAYVLLFFPGYQLQLTSIVRIILSLFYGLFCATLRTGLWIGNTCIKCIRHLIDNVKE